MDKSKRSLSDKVKRRNRERSSEWRKRNKDKVSEERRQRYLRDKEKKIADQLQWNKNNPDKVKEYKKRFGENNPERIKENNREQYLKRIGYYDVDDSPPHDGTMSDIYRQIIEEHGGTLVYSKY